VFFWATWCKECLPEIERLKELRRKYHMDGFEVIGVAFDKNRADVSNFMQQNKIDWMQLEPTSDLDRAERGSLAERLGILTMPTTILVDRGVVRATNIRGERLTQAVSGMLGRSTPPNTRTEPRVTNNPDFLEPPKNLK
jgi:thiol-disulfide isomerase/thioredoxin